MGKQAIIVQLPDEDASNLKMVANAGRTEQTMAIRSKVVLLAAQGLPLRSISQQTGLKSNNCLKWRKRFIQMRLEGLKDSPRSVKPIAISPEQRMDSAKTCQTLWFGLYDRTQDTQRCNDKTSQG
jgi:hypothetical protein